MELLDPFFPNLLWLAMPDQLTAVVFVQLRINWGEGVMYESHPCIVGWQGLENFCVENKQAQDRPPSTERSIQCCIVCKAEVTSEPVY